MRMQVEVAIRSVAHYEEKVPVVQYQGGHWRAVSWTHGRLASLSSRCRPCGSDPGSGVPGAGHCERTRQLRGSGGRPGPATAAREKYK